MIKNKKLKLVTHDGSFHTDDIFAAAILSLVFEKNNQDFEIVRTRIEDDIKNADIVFDVGGIYDAENNRFDHHQVGGAGKRVEVPNIEYSSFGLVWKKFGIELCGDQKVVDLIDKKLVSPVDSGDNGVSLVDLKTDVSPYFIQSAFNSFNPGWKDVTPDASNLAFFECVKIAKTILNNEIVKAKDVLEAEAFVTAIYESTTDKRVVVLDKKYPWFEQMQNYPEPLFVVYPRVDGSWGLEGVTLKKFSIDKRKKLPAAWAGLRDLELQKVSGVSDAVFCHRALFMGVAKSKEGAIKLAQIAVES